MAKKTSKKSTVKKPTAKKHRKLKFVDPCYRGTARQQKKKGPLEWNLPPRSDGDCQDPSRQAEEVIRSKNKKLKRKKKKKVIKDDYIIVHNEIVDKMEDGGENKPRSVPTVRQKSYESEAQFLGRIQRMANAAIAEAKVEEKYNIQLVNVDKEGNATYKSAQPQEVIDRKKEKRKLQKEKLNEKKRLKTDDKEFDLKKERVKFGEVASAPPTLKAKPRKAPELNKAGSRQLVLNKMLPLQQKEKKVAPLSAKWKTLAPEKRKSLENERLRAVQMYRNLKNKKSS